MQPPCPNCDTPLAGSTVGFLCTNCGKAYRYTEPDPEIDPLAQPHSPSEHAHHAAHHDQSPPEPPNSSVEPADTGQPQPSNQPDFQSAQITSHRRSSQAYRRLEGQQSSDSLNGVAEASHKPAASAAETVAPPLDYPITAPLSSEAPADQPDPSHDSWQAHDSARLATEAATDHSVSQPQPMDSQPETDETSYGPHKPSPHILDVASAADEPAPYAPHSPLDLSKDHDHHYTEQADRLDEVPELLPSFVDTQSPVADQPTPPPLHATATPPADPPAQSDALAKADALLAAASTPKPDTRSRSNMFLIIGVVAILMVVSGLAFLLLKPPTTTSPSTSTSPVVSSPTTTPTNTQSLASKRDKQRKDDLNDISVALAAYKKATGSYPAGQDVSALAPLTTATPAYIAKINLDPLSDEAGGVIVKYNYNSDGKTYTLTATLENKNDSDAKNGLYIVKSPSDN